MRKLREDDAQALFEYQSDRNNFPHVEMAVYSDVTEAFEFIENKNEGVEANKYIIWAIAKKKNDRIVGTISLWNFNTNNDRAEFGYGLFQGFRGKGFMAEAIIAAREFGFTQLRMKILEAYTSISNIKSIQLLKHAGFSFVDQIEEGSAILGIYRITRESFLYDLQ